VTAERGKGDTDHKKFGGVLRALNNMNWRIGVKLIVYAALKTLV